MSLYLLYTDNNNNNNNCSFRSVIAEGTLYTAIPNIGLECDKCEVNEISNEEIDTTISIRDKAKPINVSRISKRYIEGINGDVYDVDLIKRKKDSFSPISLNEQMDEFYIYNILSFDYTGITDQGLAFLYDNLRKIPNPIIKGKMAEVVLLQIFCKDEEFLKLFIRVSAKMRKAGDILFKIIIVESKNWGNYNPKEILKLCRDAAYLAGVATTPGLGKKAYKLEKDEIAYKFCLFVHFFEDSSGENDIQYYYIEPTDDGAEIKCSDSFDSNFKTPFLGIPFVTLSKLNDYLISIKAYLSNMEKVIDDYNYIKILAREFELNYNLPEMRKEIENLNKKVEDQKKEISDLKEAHKKEVSDMKEAHKKEISELKDPSRKELSDLKESHKKEISDLKESHKKGLSDLKEAHKKEITTLTNELETSKKEIATLTDELEASKKEIVILTNELEASKKEISELKETHKKEIATLTNELEASKKEIADLNQTIADMKDIHKKEIATLTIEINNLKSLILKPTSPDIVEELSSN